MTDFDARLTDRARKVWELSLREALQLGHNYIAPEHILLALCREGESLAAQALDGTAVRARVLRLMQGSMKKPQDQIAELEARVEALEASLPSHSATAQSQETPR